MKDTDKILDLIRKRRSVRLYTRKDVSNKDIEEILEAGRWAPTPSNVQSWHFGVVKKKKTLSILKNLSPGFPDTATVGIVVCSNQNKLSSFKGNDLIFLRGAESAMAVQNMLLIASVKGIGTCPVASFSRGGLVELLDLPSHIVPILLVAVGYPASTPDAPARVDLDEITFQEEYEK